MLQNASSTSITVITNFGSSNGKSIEKFELKYCQVVEKKEIKNENEKEEEEEEEEEEKDKWVVLPLISVHSSHEKSGFIKTKIQNLKIYQSYMFLCRCSNTLGWSTWSCPMITPLHTAASPPDPPSIPIVTSNSRQQQQEVRGERQESYITVAWSSCAVSHGAPIERYEVQMYTDGRTPAK